MKQVRSVSVEFWARVFGALKYLSLFWVLRHFIKGKSPDWRLRFIDRWVLGHFFLALASLFLVRWIGHPAFRFGLVIYGFLRVFEIVVYQINVLLFDEYRARQQGQPYRIHGYRRMIVNLFTNFAEIIFWFAASYSVFLFSENEAQVSVLKVLFLSFSIMTTFGVQDLNVLSETGLYILWFQSFAGLLMTVISISRFIGLLPKVDSRDEMENG